MAKWVIVTTLIVLAAGVAFMLSWTAVNQFLAGQAGGIDWVLTLVAVLVVLLAGGVFAALSNRLAVIARREESPDH